jgi:hypothetical protein
MTIKFGSVTVKPEDIFSVSSRADSKRSAWSGGKNRYYSQMVDGTATSSDQDVALGSEIDGEPKFRLTSNLHKVITIKWICI